MIRYVKMFFQFPPVKALLGFSFCLALLAVMSRLVLKPLIYAFISDVVVADTLRISLGIVWLLICYRLFTRYIERRRATELDITHWRTDVLGGGVLGFGCISLVVFILYVLGSYRLIGVSFDYSGKLFVTLLLAALIEDLLHRGLVLRILEQWLGSYLALALATSIEMLHFANDNIEFSYFNLFFFLLWGFSLGIMYIYTKRFWLPFAFHVGWNFAQPFYGSNLTGLEDMGRIIDSRFQGSELLTGGAMGVEGSIFIPFILLLLSVFFLYRSIKDGKIVKGRLTGIRSGDLFTPF